VIYLDLAILSCLGLASLKMMRDYYLIGQKSSGRYFVIRYESGGVSYLLPCL